MDRACVHDASSFFIILLLSLFCLLFIKTCYIKLLAIFEKLCLMCFIEILYLKGMMCLIKFCDLKRVPAICLKVCQFVTTYLKQLVYILLLLLCHLLASLIYLSFKRICAIRSVVCFIRFSGSQELCIS